MSVENLREACLQLVVCARARARELQVDVQVERASRAVVTAHTVTPTKGRSKPAMEPAVCKFFLTAEGCKFGDECKYKHPRTTGKCLRCGAEGHSLSTCTRPSKNKSGSQPKQSTKGKGRSTLTPSSTKPSSSAKPKAQPKKKGNKGGGKGKKDKPSGTSSTKSSAKAGDVSFDNDDVEEEEHSLKGVRTKSIPLRRRQVGLLPITPLQLPTIRMSVSYMTWKMVDWNQWAPQWLQVNHSWMQHRRNTRMRLTRLDRLALQMAR